LEYDDWTIVQDGFHFLCDLCPSVAILQKTICLSSNFVANEIGLSTFQLSF